MGTLHRTRTSSLAAVVALTFTLFAPIAIHAVRAQDAAPTSIIEANKALALQYHHDIFEQENLAVADEILAPDFVWHYPADQPFAVGP